MATAKKLEVVILGDASSALKAMQQLASGADQAGNKVKSSLGNSGDGVLKLAGSIAKVGAVVGAGAFLKGAISEAEQAQRVTAQVQQVISSTGGAANVTAGHVDSLATSLSKVSGVDEEVVAKGEAVLLTFTAVRNAAGAGNDVFDRTTKVALDMSAALGTDLQSSVIQLGKALQDPIGGLSALRRVGVSFTQQQQEQIKTLAQSGQSLQAQKLILSEVEKEFGGAAAAMATPLDKARESVKEMERALGNDLAPAVHAGASAVSTLASGFAGLPQPIQIGILGIGALGTGAVIVVPKIVALRKALQEMSMMGGASGALGSMGSSILSIVPKATLALAATEALGHGVESIFGNSLHGAKVNVDDLQASFQRLGSGQTNTSFGALGSNVEAVVGKMRSLRYETGGLQGALNTAVGGLSSFVTGGSKIDTLKNNIKSIDTALAGLVTGGHASEAKDAVDALTAAAEHQGKSAQWVTSFLKQYETALGNQQGDQQRTAALVAGTTGQLDEQANAWFQNLGALDQFTSGLHTLYSAFDKGADSQAQFTINLDNLRNSWDKTGSSFTTAADAGGRLTTILDLNSDAGAKNYKVGQQVRNSILDVAGATYQQTGSMDAATAAAGPLIDSFRRTLAQQGLNTQQQDIYLQALGLTPSEVKTAIRLSGAQPALGDIHGVSDALDNLNGKTATVVINTVHHIEDIASGLLHGRAAGGPVLAGKSYLIGEKGPEVLTMPGSGYIIPNDKLRSVAASAPTGSMPSQPPATQIVQLVVDRRVLAQAVIEDVRRHA